MSLKTFEHVLILAAEPEKKRVDTKAPVSCTFGISTFRTFGTFVSLWEN